jgi:hypothetical protein
VEGAVGEVPPTDFKMPWAFSVASPMPKVKKKMAVELKAHLARKLMRRFKQIAQKTSTL